MYDEIDDLNPDNKKKNKRHKELLDQLKDVEESSDYTMLPNGSFLPSSLLKDKKEKEEKTKTKDISEAESYLPDDSDDWLNAIMGMKISKPHGGKGKDLFALSGISKKKKKKKKDKNELTNFSKEFEPEINLYRNLLQDQNRFTDSLQREYDAIKSSKSSARGVNKTMSDLIKNITEARALSMQLVEKNVNTKKLISELTMKEKKELGVGLGDGENMADFAGTLLNKMISERGSIINGASTAEVSDYTEDELFDSLAESLSDNSRPSDVEKYLKYENRNITIYAVVNTADVEDYDYIAKDEEGNIIEDYPLPYKTSISVNRSTNYATDAYGKKYQIIWK
jgi:hypothetical protein